MKCARLYYDNNSEFLKDDYPDLFFRSSVHFVQYFSMLLVIYVYCLQTDQVVYHTLELMFEVLVAS